MNEQEIRKQFKKDLNKRDNFFTNLGYLKAKKEFDKKIEELENKGEWIEKANGTELWVINLNWIKKLRRKMNE